MNLILNGQGRIIAAAGYPVNEEDCATRGETVVYIDDSVYQQKMIGALYVSSDPYFLEPPSPFHDVVDGTFVLTEDGAKRFWDEVKAFRNYLLTQSDWTQLPDTNLIPDEVEHYKQYRIELRSVTDKFEDPGEAFRHLESLSVAAKIVKVV